LIAYEGGLIEFVVFGILEWAMMVLHWILDLTRRLGFFLNGLLRFDI
jgi:hypothetical protein